MIIQMYGFIFFCREICKCQNTDSVCRFLCLNAFPSIANSDSSAFFFLPPKFDCFGKYDCSTPSPTKKKNPQENHITTSSHKDLYIQDACAAFQHFSNTCQKAAHHDVARKQPGTDLTASLTNPLDGWPPSAKVTPFLDELAARAAHIMVNNLEALLPTYTTAATFHHPKESGSRAA